MSLNQNTETFTRFVRPLDDQPTQLFYSAERWARVKLTLQTAGPVAFGTTAELMPIFSGRGILLATNQETEVILARGTRLYMATTALNSVRVVIEPIPYLESILHTLEQGFCSLAGIFRRGA